MSGTTKRGFTLINEEPAPAPTPDTVAAQHQAALLMLSLRALSQRALTAITNLFTLALVASVWALLWHILPDPTLPQLVGVGGYSAFVVTVELIRRRK